MNQIKAIRKAMGYTQQTLAEAMGVERPTVGMWEIGRNYPTVELLIRLADVLGVTTDALLGRETEANARGPAAAGTSSDPASRATFPRGEGKDSKEEETMKEITLNDLLGICEAERLRLRVPMTARLTATVDVETTDSAALEDIVEVYGKMLVKAIDVLNTSIPTLLVELKR